MRHARRVARLSRTSEHREATLANMARNLVRHGRIHTTVTKGKEAQRVVDRLVSLGKDGSVHARRQAYRVLQDRDLVKRLFAELAPQFLDCSGGYTRLLKLSIRPGDGAHVALLELTRLPATESPRTPKAVAQKSAPSATKTPSPTSQAPSTKRAKDATTEEPKKGKGFFEGFREWFKPKQSGPQP